jgi:hypothetical protein
MSTKRTKLHLRPGQLGRLTVGANVAVKEETVDWHSSSDVVVMDKTKSRTPFDMIVVASALGLGIVEFHVEDAAGENLIEHIFEIEVSDAGTDDDLFGDARVSRESFLTDGTIPISSSDDVAPSPFPPPAIKEDDTAHPAVAETGPVATSDGAPDMVPVSEVIPAETDGAGQVANVPTDVVSETATEAAADEVVAESAETPVPDTGLMAGFQEDAAAAGGTADDAATSELASEETSPTSDAPVGTVDDSTTFAASEEVPVPEEANAESASETSDPAVVDDSGKQLKPDARSEEDVQTASPEPLLDASATEEAGSE